MAHTFYDATIAVAQATLNSLSHILHKAEVRPEASTLLETRLYEDMYPLPGQIRLATQFSENMAAKLSGREPVVYEGNPSTFAECYERIEKVLKALSEADKDVVNQHAEVSGPTKLGPDRIVDMSGAAYAHTVALPNIYFHVTTAYCILRKEGVPVGKLDYYVGFFPELAQRQ